MFRSSDFITSVPPDEQAVRFDHYQWLILAAVIVAIGGVCAALYRNQFKEQSKTVDSDEADSLLVGYGSTRKWRVGRPKGGADCVFRFERRCSDTVICRSNAIIAFRVHLSGGGSDQKRTLMTWPVEDNTVTANHGAIPFIFCFCIFPDKICTSKLIQLFA